MNIAELHGALARGYCTKRNAKKIVDPDLIHDMADEVIQYVIKVRIEELEKLQEKYADNDFDFQVYHVLNKRIAELKKGDSNGKL